MKKVRFVLLLLAALSLAGCGTGDNRAGKESAIGNQLPTFEREQYMTVNEEGDSEKGEDVETHLVHRSEWYPYMDVSDFLEGEYEQARNHDFMNSGEQYVHMFWYYEFIDILYDYGERRNQNLLSDGWVVERITPIGSSYYNALLHQKENSVRADLLLNTEEGEYKILYVICDKGERTSYDELHYMSQYEWKPYIQGEGSAEIDNPFFEIYETSTDMYLTDAVTAYEKEMEYDGEWTVEEIYAYSSLRNFFLTAEDRVVWFCLDVYTDEYTAETFYIESQ